MEFDKQNIRGIAHARTNRKNNIFIQRRRWAYSAQRYFSFLKPPIWFCVHRRSIFLLAGLCSLNTQCHQGAGLKYLRIRNDLLASSRDGLAGRQCESFPQDQTKWKLLIHSALFDRQINETHVLKMTVCLFRRKASLLLQLAGAN